MKQGPDGQLTTIRTWWYKRFRAAAYANTLLWLAWTVAILLPTPPFSDLQPIMAGGSAGTWLLLAYVLFLAVGVLGFAAISTFIFIIETHEQRRPNYRIMLTGLTLSYVGTLASLLSLAVAGEIGGYSLVIAHSTVNATQNLLSPYVNFITATCLAAIMGTGLIVYGMCTAKGN